MGFLHRLASEKRKNLVRVVPAEAMINPRGVFRLISAAIIGRTSVTLRHVVTSTTNGLCVRAGDNEDEKGSA